VKARLNADVNEEWMCDEGRYGFNRFLPEKRLIDPLILEQGSFKQASWKEAFSSAKELKGDGVAVFVSSFLTLEEMWTAYQFADKVLGLKADGSEVATQLVRRELSSVEAKLISPDYAPNARAAALCGVQAATAEDWRAQLEARYRALVERVKGGSAERILFIGDLSVRAEDLDSDFRKAVAAAEVSVFIGASGSGEGVESSCKVLLPSRTVHEKNGVFVNANYQAQRLKELMPAPFGTLPEWSIINQLAAAFGVSLLPKEVLDERSLLKHVSAQLPQLGELTFGRLGETGINLAEESSGRGSGTNSQGASA